MRMTDLANLLLVTAQAHGDREVTLIEEGTGEVRYVEAISFSSNGGEIELEHVGYGEKILIEQLNALGGM